MRSFSVFAFAAVLAFSSAFSPTRAPRWVKMSCDGHVSRRDALVTSLGASSAFLAASPAQAVILTARGSSVANPKTAEIDKDLLKSESVQSQVQQVEKVRGTVKKLQAGLDANMQVDLSPIFGKDLDTLKLRNSLNKINEVVVDEETQRGTDRLTRTIIQDVYELEASSKVKDGYARSAKKAASMQAKLVKLDESFGQYLAFFK
jgi:hypothetical protein